MVTAAIRPMPLWQALFYFGLPAILFRASIYYGTPALIDLGLGHRRSSGLIPEHRGAFAVGGLAGSGPSRDRSARLLPALAEARHHS